MEDISGQAGKQFSFAVCQAEKRRKEEAP